MPAKLTIEHAHDLANSRGFQFLSTEFKNTKTKHLWGCEKGHEWNAVFRSIYQGSGCPHCAVKNIKDAHNLAIFRGFKFLSLEFKNTNTKHLWGCGQGHQWLAKYNDIQQGKGCLHCSGKFPKTIQDAHDLAKSRGYKFLSPEFKNVKTKYLWECKLGHQWSAVYDNIKRSTGCPLCSDNLRGEKLTRYCFVKMFRCYFDKIKPDWIRNPKTGRKLELDGYNELLKIAFEHQGQSHELDCPKESMLYNSEQIFRDEIKRQKCKEHGITLIEVPEIGRRLKVKDVVPFLLSEFDKHNIAYPESAKSFQIDMKEFYAEYIN